MIFVDTNYFVRFLLRDVELQFGKARKLFEDAADGRKVLFTSTIVIFEIYWLFYIHILNISFNLADIFLVLFSVVGGIFILIKR